MNRLGWLLLAGFVALLAAFVALVDPPRLMEPVAAPPPVAVPAGPSLAIPVAGVRPEQLVDSFADARGEGTRTHGAIDIPAPRGTPALASADGRVEKLFDSRLGGRTLYLRSADGATLYYYAHLDGYAPGIAEGSTPRRGQPIATVGATGDADPSSPHLHFEIHRMTPGEEWWQGTAINPYPLLAAPAGAR